MKKAIKIKEKTIKKHKKDEIKQKYAFIKIVLNCEFTNKKITKKWDTPKQLISYWRNTEIKTEENRKKNEMKIKYIYSN